MPKVGMKGKTPQKDVWQQLSEAQSKRDKAFEKVVDNSFYLHLAGQLPSIQTIQAERELVKAFRVRANIGGMDVDQPILDINIDGKDEAILNQYQTIIAKLAVQSARLPASTLKVVAEEVLRKLRSKAPFARHFLENLSLDKLKEAVKDEKANQTFAELIALDEEIVRLQNERDKLFGPLPALSKPDEKSSEREAVDLRFEPLSNDQIPDAKDLKIDLIADYKKAQNTLLEDIDKIKKELGDAELVTKDSKIISVGRASAAKRHEALTGSLTVLQEKLRKVTETLTNHSKTQNERLNTIKEANESKATDEIERAHFLKQILPIVIQEVQVALKGEKPWASTLIEQYQKSFQIYICQHQNRILPHCFNEVVKLIAEEDLFERDKSKAFKTACSLTRVSLIQELEGVKIFLAQTAAPMPEHIKGIRFSNFALSDDKQGLPQYPKITATAPKVPQAKATSDVPVALTRYPSSDVSGSPLANSSMFNVSRRSSQSSEGGNYSVNSRGRSRSIDIEDLFMSDAEDNPPHLGSKPL